MFFDKQEFLVSLRFKIIGGTNAVPGEIHSLKHLGFYFLKKNSLMGELVKVRFAKIDV